MQAEHFAPAVCSVGGCLYVLGGFDANGSDTATVERYDPREGTWQFVAPMPAAKGWHAAASLCGKVYSIGGDQYLSTVERYDPTATLWASVAPLQHGRHRLAAVAC